MPQPQAFATYNKYMNAADRSDQILATNNVLRKCKRWWKTLFFHLIDTADFPDHDVPPVYSNIIPPAPPGPRPGCRKASYANPELKVNQIIDFSCIKMFFTTYVLFFVV